MGMQTVWMVLWVSNTASGLLISHDVHPAVRLDAEPLMETPVTSHCMCRTRCIAMVGCVAWSSFISGGQMVCHLTDSTPQSLDLVPDPTAATGFDSIAKPEISTETSLAPLSTTTVTSLPPTPPSPPPTITTTHPPQPPTTTPTLPPPRTTITTPPPPPTTTTAITTTPSPPTTTTTASITYDTIIKKEESCDKNYGLTGLALRIGAPEMSDIDWLVCTRPSLPEHALPFETGTVSDPAPMDPLHAEPCNPGYVVTSIYDFGGKGLDISWNNTKFLDAICHPVFNWVVDSLDCQDVALSQGAWPGVVNDTQQTNKWDYWFICPQGYMVVQIYRQFDDTETQRQVTKITCCRVGANDQLLSSAALDN